ncbi:MAG: class I SAM-dependent methyltransferase [Gaiellaceae bacterium]|nr:class I SAM-dependent methyltransferase [Gaiellaceae bacterium]
MRETIERLVPGRAGIEQEVIEAMHRYAYAMLADFAGRRDRVLEIGFGEGYGSAMLAGVVGEYVGIEVDRAAVEHASRVYARPGASFLHYDGSRLPFDSGSFDVVFAFQVLEHVVDAGVLQEARRVARPDGRVLIVTPNRTHRVRDGERPWNRYHVREYSPEELEALMRSVFPSVDLYGIVGSHTMNEIERRRVQRARRLARIDRLGLRYHLPGVLDHSLRALLRRLGSASPSPEPGEVSIERVRRVTDGIEEALDLLAVATCG